MYLYFLLTNNNKMNYKKLFGWGILFYVVAFLIMSGFIAYGAGTSFMAKISTIIAVAIVVFFAGRNLNESSAGGILKYSISWVIIVAILDVLFTVRFTGWGIFSLWNIWLGYVIILLLPLLVYKLYKRQELSQ